MVGNSASMESAGTGAISSVVRPSWVNEYLSCAISSADLLNVPRLSIAYLHRAHIGLMQHLSFLKCPKQGSLERCGSLQLRVAILWPEFRSCFP